ncbi:site-specific integrase, partial [Flavobacterium sp.]|uniref:site-specific integrase n=1 Tax=Flavobacterium sp. TaxID=239 RepID=UPI000EC39A0C
MSSFLPILYKVYDLVYDSVYGFDQNFYYIAKHLNISNQKIMSKPNYSIPKIYTGGIDISIWKQLSVDEQSKALKKEWYIYYSFRCPQSGLLKRVTPIKGYANSYKSMKERMQYLNTLRDSLELLLKNGANPFENNDFSYLDDYFNETTKPKTSNSEVKVADEVKPIEEKKKAVVDKQKIDSIKNSFENVLNIKKNQMNLTSYKNYKLRIMRFMNYLPDASLPIDSIVKKDVINFLNEILETTSPRSRNNYRTDLNSFFNELENNEYIENNFIAKINVLKSNPERNKTFSDKIQKEIYEYLGEEDKMLLLFIQFISY